jgi:hypothetical protein
MTLAETWHQKREKAAWEAFEKAWRSGDRDETRRLWWAFTRIHKQRPASLVARLEREKGLV